MYRICIFLFLLSCSTAPRAHSAASTTTGGETYRNRYPLATAAEKLVDNRGAGHENLYGTRNVRAVLNGVYYRGGANNYYHRTKKRANSNPLPDDGLQNLCEEGFGRAVYLYSKNFRTAPPQTNCRNFEQNDQRLEYEQISMPNKDRGEVRRLLSLIHEHIRNPRLGPIYAHCWNGWHASGFAAAAALRQFCGFSADEAVRYWNLNTDGNNGKAYEGVRRMVRDFEPFPDLEITAEEKQMLCPDPVTLAFR